MSPFDRQVRAAVYRWFRDETSAPTIDQLAAEFEVPGDEIARSLRALADEHCLVLRRNGEVWMAHPFSAVETDCVVEVGDKRWFANCAWDAFAILAVMGNGAFETSSPATGEPLRFTARDGKVEGEGVVHFLVPAREFWADIGHT